MLRTFTASLVLCGLGAAQGLDRTKPPETPPLAPYRLPPVHETKLKNGLTVMLVEDNRFPVVTVRLAFLSGWRMNAATQAGLAEATAALLTEGTKSRPARQIAEEATAMGGTLNAEASADALTLNGSALSEHTADLIALAADVVRNSTFPADEAALYRKNRKQKLLEQRSQPEFLSQEKMNQVLFGKNSYAHPMEEPGEIDALTSEKMTQFRDTYLAPNNAVLLVLGQTPPRAELLKLIEAKFGDWKPRSIPALKDQPPPASAKSITLVDRPGSVQAQIQVGHLGITRLDADYFPLAVGNSILGGGTSSRLFNDIREKKGYAYSVYSYHAAYKDAGFFQAGMQVRNDVAGDAAGDMLEHLSRISKEKVSVAELSNVKNYLSGNFVLRLERQEGLAGQLMLLKTMGLPKDFLEMYTTKIRSVEPDQILKAAQRVINPANSAIVVVGDAKQVAPKLEKLGKVEVTPSK
jgi:zinc protease